MRIKWYPRPHYGRWTWAHGLETGVANTYTILPIAMYDEGLGTPSAYEANPEHASFADAGEANCFPDSDVEYINVTLTYALTKGALRTDELISVKCMFMPIHCAFLEDYNALDELSGLTTATILEMQTESTDRQGYPLYNAVDMLTHGVFANTMPVNLPGLT